jgi:hypothetical protein
MVPTSNSDVEQQVAYHEVGEKEGERREGRKRPAPGRGDQRRQADQRQRADERAESDKPRLRRDHGT